MEENIRKDLHWCFYKYAVLTQNNDGNTAAAAATTTTATTKEMFTERQLINIKSWKQNSSAENLNENARQLLDARYTKMLAEYKET